MMSTRGGASMRVSGRVKGDEVVGDYFTTGIDLSMELWMLGAWGETMARRTPESC